VKFADIKGITSRWKH